MSEKRKDNKGRLLRTGEGQRKDLTYMYRYKDNDGTRRSVYAPSLAELRAKEEEISKKLQAGVVIGREGVTVLSTVEAYLATKNQVKEKTMDAYQNVCNKLRCSPMATRQLASVTRQEMKLWFIELNRAGNRYGLLAILFGLMKNAFEQAVEDDVIVKNPCSFRLSQVVPRDLGHRDAVSEEVIDTLLSYTRDTKKYHQWYLMLAVMAHTGMRCGEVCGLTINDVDFSRNVITIRRQATKTSRGERKLETLKTASANRDFPMNTELRALMRQCIDERRRDKTTLVVNGERDFLFQTKDHKLRAGWDIDHALPRIIASYNKKHRDPLPAITPHVLRHTFCTTSIAKGMDPKSVQYLMGHASAEITMRVYAHSRFEDVQQAYRVAYGT